MRIFGRGFNFSQDGPGNRLVYHLSGCNMRCIWCSNPDGMAADAGKRIEKEALLAEIKSARALFFGGGGVTFTGGEATLWHEELLYLLREARRAGIHTAIETNGTSERLSELLPEIDYLIMDFKHYDGEMLKKYTGMDNRTVKENFERITRSGRQLHIRIPLINGFNTDDPRAFASYFASQNTESTVFEFLPYHEYGREKWKGEYLVKDGFVRDDTLAEFEQVFKEYGLKTVKT